MSNPTSQRPVKATPTDVDPLDPMVARLVRRKARRLIGRAGLTHSDFDDLVQDLYLRLLFNLDLYDPGRASPATFVAMVVDRAFSKIIRHRRAAMRDHRRVAAWETTTPAEDGRAREPAATEDADGVGRAMDLSEALDALPPDLRSLAEQLKQNTLIEIARATGIPRTTLSSRRKAILARFRQAGLDIYL